THFSKLWTSLYILIDCQTNKRQSFLKFFKKMSSKFLAELSNDYEKLFEEEIEYDVIIYAGEEHDVKEIHAHSNILSIRSKYFRAAFSNERTEKKDGKFILRKPNISPHLFNIILRRSEEHTS